MKQVFITLLLITAIIFAGCSSSPDTNLKDDVVVELDSAEDEVPTMEKSIEEDFSSDVEDIEMGELI
ncbi:MAG: hypothetical protein VXZ40_00765 [Nanoarchaeota archaeon]|nr:hypothetical protein [Nanoarchaeota archaeon]